jgi:hypothetical protein
MLVINTFYYFYLKYYLLIYITMTYNNIQNLINLINTIDKIEYHIFINYITTKSIYFYKYINVIKNNKSII